MESDVAADLGAHCRHFVSLNFPLGHIKSTMSNDQEFLDHFEQSAKWLRCRSNFV